MALTIKLLKSGTIVIRMPKATLARVTRDHPDLWDDATPEVVDSGLLAKDVYDILEGGETLVQEMFDAAILEAVERGCDGVVLP
jgi:hypothetical protein